MSKGLTAEQRIRLQSASEERSKLARFVRSKTVDGAKSVDQVVYVADILAYIRGRNKRTRKATGGRAG